MPRTVVAKDCVVLVCDGSRAVFYRNVGTATAISLRAIASLNEPHPPNRELGSDRPGRTYDAMDGSRSAVESTDWHQVAEDRFMHTVAARLDDLVRAETVPALLLIAPPHALGIVRELLTDTVRKIETGELAKDLVKTPKAKLEHYLQELGELR